MTKNEEIIYAPIEIESADQLHALGATWDDCKTWRIGAKPVTVFLVPADEETRDFLLKELQTKYEHYSRRTRCLVPGVRKSLIICPERNHCDQCPYGRVKDPGASVPLSLDTLIEDGFEMEAGDSTAAAAEASIELERILKRLYEVNPIYVRLVTLRAEGYTVEEITSIMHISRATFFCMQKEIRTLGQEGRA